MDRQGLDIVSLSTPSADKVRVPARIDFANFSNGTLLVYGWILGLSSEVAKAEIRYGHLLVDLLKVAVPIDRPDVTKQFASQPGANVDGHGFYLALSIPETSATLGMLSLSVSQHRGGTADGSWPVTKGQAEVAAFFEKNSTTLESLLKKLRVADAAPLRAATAHPTDSRHSRIDLAMGLECCCLLKERFLVVVGWVDAELKVDAATLTIGLEKMDVLGGVEVIGPTERHASKAVRSQKPAVFCLVASVSEQTSATEIVLELTAGARNGRAHRAIAAHTAEIDSAISSMDSDQALSILEHVLKALRAASETPIGLIQGLLASAVARLPTSLDSSDLKFFLHFDTVVSTGSVGVFLHGWYFADIDARLVCHGLGADFDIGAACIRRTRADVKAHLEAQGFTSPSGELGFVCFVPGKRLDEPIYLAVSSNGMKRRVRLQVSHDSDVLNKIQSMLTSFILPQRQLRKLLNEHVGPAVHLAWQQRRRPPEPSITRSFGVAPSNPSVSVIVPLHGRYDLAEYQMALFADDNDFQSVELIYFVDDPAIIDAFSAQCHDLFQTYRVPFKIAYAGENLGFAGANNCAATIARGTHLLLLNSDVMPKTRGWLTSMLTLYGSLEGPGCLSVKLLYEDGSVQHAGMCFRRHAPWDDMWINEHPYKGQTARGLEGARRVDAVSAACLLVDTKLYRDLGGLSEDYIVGDFEDSDFCLRAAAMGRKHWVALDIELYHLERQSQARIGSSQWRTNLTLYNCWQHHRRWADYLEEVHG